MTRIPHFTRKQWLAIGLAPLAVLALGVGGYYAWLMTPPPIPTTAEEAVETLASPRFRRLPEERRRHYLEAARDLAEQLDEDERRELFRDAWEDESFRRSVADARRQWFQRQLQTFARADAEERTRMLDQVIALQETMGGRFGDRGESGPDDPDDDARHGRARQRIQQHMEQGNPQMTGLAIEFFQALRQRREQRGRD